MHIALKEDERLKKLSSPSGGVYQMQGRPAVYSILGYKLTHMDGYAVSPAHGCFFI